MATNSANSHPTYWPYPFWIAHRGAGLSAPENTLAAFKLGAQSGFRAFECDVKLSQDNVAFLLHDTELNRTTNGTGIASEQPWDQLARLDAGSWHSAAFAGEPLLRLRDLARFCIAGDYCLNLEIKPSPGQDAKTGQLVAKEASQLWHEVKSTLPLLSSFSDEALAAASQTAPQLPRALLLDKLSPDWLERAERLSCVAIVAHHTLFDARMMPRLRSARLRALAYTVNDRQTASELISLGVDGIITDSVINHELTLLTSRLSEH